MRHDQIHSVHLLNDSCNCYSDAFNPETKPRHSSSNPKINSEPTPASSTDKFWETHQRNNHAAPTPIELKQRAS